MYISPNCGHTTCRSMIVQLASDPAMRFVSNMALPQGMAGHQPCKWHTPVKRIYANALVFNWYTAEFSGSCVSDCSVMPPGFYQACSGCASGNYVGCSGTVLSSMACTAGSYWDDVAKNCLAVSTTCTGECMVV